MKVLIIKLSSIGDVVQTLPALRALRAALEKRASRGGPKAEIDWLVEEPASSILMERPDIDNVYVVKRRGWKKGIGDNLRMARLLASRDYDMVLDFQGLLKSGVWVMLTGGKRRLGFSNARELSHVFLNEKLPPYDPDVHAVDRYLDLARHAGGAELAADKAPPPLVDPSGAAGRSVAAKLAEGGVDGKTPFFVLATQARWATKLWAPERFAELARRVLERNGALRAVLVGAASDTGRCESIRSRMGGCAGRAVNLAGRTDLRELAALMQMAAFVVTVDSGPMHIAAAAGARVIALFGPTAPWRTGPYGKGHTVLRKDLECSPCFRKECPEPRCMEEITVEEVLACVEGAMERMRRTTA